jgi:alginate O-acetyltransferase complex protein AlgI
VPSYQTNTIETTGLALNSWEFLLIVGAATLVCGLTGHFKTRIFALLAVNIYVLTKFITTLSSFLTLGLFLGSVYLVGIWKKSRGDRLSTITQLSIIALMWIFLFLVRDGNLFVHANPFYYMPVYIIGISYMVFRCISFLMEIEFIEKPSFIRFCTYVLFFPGLIAGPIERYRNFEKQTATPDYNADDVMPALHRIANGMIKKFIFADNLSAFGVFSFPDASAVATPTLWIGTLGQLWLIYLDFSGYCDIVIGIARLMGFRMIENFNDPFRSLSIQEFWNRWHISLSTLVKDYIFTPINKLIILNVRRNLQFAFITFTYFFSMILIGLWHGTTWGFVAFGALHGAALICVQLTRKYHTPLSTMAWYGIYMRRFLVYAFVSISLIFWMKSVSEWGRIYAKLLGIEL